MIAVRSFVGRISWGVFVKVIAAVRRVGVAVLCGLLAGGTVPAAAQAVSGSITAPADCPAKTSGDLGRPWYGAFTVSEQAGCFTLPALAANTSVMVIQPIAGSSAVPVATTVLDAGGAVACSADRLAKSACALTGVAPWRLVVTPAAPDTVGDYRVEVLQVTGDTGCVTQLPPGTVGSGTGVAATLSEDSFAACFRIPADGHSSTELFTLARTAGSGAAQIAVYSQSGPKAGCAAPTVAVLASVFWCNLLPSTAYTVVVWGAAVPATFQLSQRDITPASLTCQPLAVTEIGGPATAGTIGSAADVRCYDFTAPPGDRDAVVIRSPGGQVKLDWVNANGSFYCQGWGGLCTTDGESTERHYRIVVWAAATDPTSFQIDAWALAHGGVTSARCHRLPSVAYGSPPVTVTLNDQYTAQCLVAPVGIEDRFQVPVTAPDPATVAPAVYVFAPSAPNGQWYAAPCPAAGCGTLASVPRGQSTDGLFLLTQGNQFGPVSYGTQITCLTVLCGGQPYLVTGVSPASVPASKVSITVSGSGFDLSDTAHVVRDGSAPITAVVRQVSADRHTLTADVDLTAAAAGYWEMTTFSTRVGPAAPSLYDAFIVTGPALKSTSLPSISGTVKAGATVKTSTGTWTPTATSYAYQWLSNGSPISGATKSTYVVPTSLRGKKLSVTVTAKLEFHPDGKATSAAKLVA
jgi:hypothetical protein